MNLIILPFKLWMVIVMDKLIDPDKLFSAIRDDAEINGKTYARVKEHIFNAEDELVRCKECWHRYTNEHGEPCCEIWQHNRYTVVRDCDFCSYGKRRINV